MRSGYQSLWPEIYLTVFRCGFLLLCFQPWSICIFNIMCVHACAYTNLCKKVTVPKPTIHKMKLKSVDINTSFTLYTCIINLKPGLELQTMHFYRPSRLGSNKGDNNSTIYSVWMPSNEEKNSQRMVCVAPSSCWLGQTKNKFNQILLQKAKQYFISA